MPERKTIKKARKDARQGKSASTQAGEFVREEIHHIREGKHGARSTKQAIAIGLSKARRAGVALPAQGKRSTGTKAKHITEKHVNPRRSRAAERALKRAPHKAASKKSLSRHAKQVARTRARKAA